MHMVMFAVKFHQFRLKVFAHTGEHRLHRIEVFFLKYVPATLRYKHQMNVKRKNTMSPVP